MILSNQIRGIDNRLNNVRNNILLVCLLVFLENVLGIVLGTLTTYIADTDVTYRVDIVKYPLYFKVFGAVIFAPLTETLVFQLWDNKVYIFFV